MFFDETETHHTPANVCISFLWPFLPSS